MKNFRLHIILRILALAVTLGGCLYLWINTGYFILSIVLSLLTVYEIVLLIYYVELTNRELSRFLDSIRYSDFTRTFSRDNPGKSFQELNAAMAEIIEKFKEQRVEKQAQFRYLQTVIDHIGMGVISFNQKGEVQLLNNAAKRIFQIAVLRRISNLKSIHPRLIKTINRLKSGEHDIVTLTVNQKTVQLAIHATVFRLRDEMVKLISFHDINKELEDKQMEAWQNLTQVLAHEIMNSVTPIASLSDTVQMIIEQNKEENATSYRFKKEAIDDVSEALATIENRSNGLIRFVNSYRDYNKEPRPNITLFSVQKLFDRIQNLNKGEAKKRNIKITARVNPSSLELTADVHLTEQVLINLIKNAFRALEKQNEGEILLTGTLNAGRICISIKDNGPGIESENLEKIFIPFFSTQQPFKEGGTGIGLSLSQKMMHAQGGSISVQSEPGNGTTFTLRF